ncbi:hypothetical protein L8956_01650 [Peribacillus frigoritolerans]|uniref:hypothetical protein n=1 Tax=Peribacillus frigoritolerans TaxID=450367 RepID=UPI001EFCE7C1|nr:hypothetical protein [Peribacillus frigoritolerans]ULM97498.1 hypothetical protein L8956_01650 [Peribacillus frigoritolerans]
MKIIRVRETGVKRIIVPAVASAFLFSAFAPFSKASASELNESTIRTNTEIGSIIVTEQTQISLEEIESVIADQSTPSSLLMQQANPVNPYDGTQMSSEIIQQLENESKKRGFKKTVVVYALKYGGTAMGKIVGSLSPANGKLLKKHAFEIGDALDRMSNKIEARLVDFMIHELGFAPSAARSSAWAIALWVL